MNKTSAIFAQAVDDLKGRLGVSSSELLPDELVGLVFACAKVANPFSEVNADAAGFPIRVCEGVYFWKLTIGASIWLDSVEKLIGTDDKRYRLALIYACKNARNPIAFDGLDTLDAISREIKASLKNIPATAAEINAALDILFKLRVGREPAVSQETAADWVNVCSRLETQTGIPAKEWMWERSGAYAVKCYNDLHEFARAYSAATGTGFGHMRDELDDAVNALQMLKFNIARRVKNG